MAMEALAGTAFFQADGVNYMLVGTCSYRTASPTREMKSGLDGPHGFSRKLGWGQIKAKLRNNSNVSVAAIGNMENSTVTLRLANGKTVVGRNMFTTEPPVTDVDEGEIDVTWEGPDVTEN